MWKTYRVIIWNPIAPRQFKVAPKGLFTFGRAFCSCALPGLPPVSHRHGRAFFPARSQDYRQCFTVMAGLARLIAITRSALAARTRRGRGRGFATRICVGRFFEDLRRNQSPCKFYTQFFSLCWSNWSNYALKKACNLSLFRNFSCWVSTYGSTFQDSVQVVGVLIVFFIKVASARCRPQSVGSFIRSSLMNSKRLSRDHHDPKGF